MSEDKTREDNVQTSFNIISEAADFMGNAALNKMPPNSYEDITQSLVASAIFCGEKLEAGVRSIPNYQDDQSIVDGLDQLAADLQDLRSFQETFENE